MSTSDRPAENSRAWFGLVALATTLACLTNGCGPAANLYYPAEGLVLVNGEPSANVCVAFHLVEPGDDPRFSVGRTNAEGRFQLSTESGSYGAPPGEYVVTLVWVDDTGDECKCAEPLKHDLFQGRYADPQLSGMRVTVRPSGENSYLFHARRLPDSPRSAVARAPHEF